MLSQLDSSTATPTQVSATDRWCINGALTIGTVAEWYSRFAERAAAAQELELDLTGVTAADVFGLQLLCSVKRSATEGGRKLKVTAVPPVILDAATSTGFALNL